MNQPPTPKPPPSEDPYDALPYDGGVAPHSLPAEMAAANILLGAPTVDPLGERFRVLEIGCGVGTNLLSIAAIDPRCECVGVDRSAEQITRAQRRSERLGLTTIRWITADIRDLSAQRLGRFDFIICHGVLSWVPFAVRSALLRTIHTHLGQRGTAYISFNVMPGWGAGLALRDGLLRLVPRHASPQAQVAAARRVLGLLEEASEPSALGRFTQSRAKAMLGFPDDYLFHEYLEADNSPLWFADFAEEARAQGLQWIGNANLCGPLALLPPTVRSHLSSIADPIEREQARDILTMNTFRYALCQRADDTGRSPAGKRPQPNPDTLVGSGRPALSALHYSAALKPPEEWSWSLVEPAEFTHPDGYSLRAIFPVAKAACLELAQRWPASASLVELLDAAHTRMAQAGLTPSEGDGERLAGFLRSAALSQCVRVLAWLPGSTATPLTQPPRAWPLARLLALEGALTLPTAQHTLTTIDAQERALLIRCDGHTPTTALKADATVCAGTVPVEETLERWYRWGLLCGNPAASPP